MSYLKAVNGWIRLAAISTLFLALGSGTALADGSGNSVGLSGSSTTATAPSAAAATTTTSTGSPTNDTANVLPPTASAGPSTPTISSVAAGSSSATTSSPATSSSSSVSRLTLAPHSFGSRLLSPGSRGTDVVALQHDLTALGFTSTASGSFSHQTLTALKAFQRRYHLTVDGVAGPTSISKLKVLLRSSLHITEAPETDGVAATATSTPAATEPLSAADSGGVGVVPAAPTAASAPVQNATLIDGLAVAAPGTPEVVQQVLNAANQIAFDPYIYGGGHASFTAAGYDCSGSVSFALHAGGLLATPLDSSQFLQYGEPGLGQWITIYTNGPTHAYMEIAGLWFDTAAQDASNGNDRWSVTRINEPPQYYGKFVPRHPAGW